MAAQFGSAEQSGGKASTSTGLALKDLPKSSGFTSYLPPDAAFPTPKDSHNAPREKLGPRMVREAMYTFVRPDIVEQPELLAVSPRAMTDLGIVEGDQETTEFKNAVAGNQILTWDEKTAEGIYPWAQCYGGWQFGNWAGQLGDGRAISLFETTNANTNVKYELQLKGAGRTPYSRFADGKAVLRSSIREFVVSEALNALDIPTTRALSLTLCPKSRVIRETMEPGAVVARFAQSWLRIGTFDLLRSRGDRKLIRKLSTYIAEQSFPGWASLPARIELNEIKEDSKEAVSVTRDVPEKELQGAFEVQENRFARLYREIVRRNAKTVAAWQAYAFTNGVLNTDNTSIFGLSIDFGPFAFLDNFDPSYTPNHDDHMLRYAYRNQPTIIWWNLVRLGEDMGELLGSGDQCDDETFIEKGVTEDFAPVLIKRAESIIDRAGDEFKAVFLAEYRRHMGRRLGLNDPGVTSLSPESLLSTWLDVLESLELDFNQSFRKLSSLKTTELDSEDECRAAAGRFFHHEGVSAAGETDESARRKMGQWLERWREQIIADWGEGPDADEAREIAMKKVNPKFIPKNWILDELIDRVERKDEREILGRVMHMALHPFDDQVSADKSMQDEYERFCGDVPKVGRAMQCSCSS